MEQKLKNRVLSHCNSNSLFIPFHCATNETTLLLLHDHLANAIISSTSILHLSSWYLCYLRYFDILDRSAYFIVFLVGAAFLLFIFNSSPHTCRLIGLPQKKFTIINTNLFCHRSTYPMNFFAKNLCHIFDCTLYFSKQVFSISSTYHSLVFVTP